MAIEVEQERLYREYNNYSLLSTIRSMTTFITKSQIIIHQQERMLFINIYDKVSKDDTVKLAALKQIIITTRGSGNS